MKRLFLITLFSLFLLSSVIADNVTLVLPDSSILVYAGEQNTIEIPIKNVGNQKDTVYVSIWPTEWVNLKTYWVSLEPGETKSVSLIVEPPKNSKEGVVVFTITSNSLVTDDITSSPLYLNIKRKTDIFLSEIKLNKQSLEPGESLTIQPVITNLDKYIDFEVFVTTDIFKDDKLVKKIEGNISLEPESSKTMTHFLNIDNTYERGNYLIKSTINDNLNQFLDEREIDFEVEELIKIDKKEVTEWGLLYFEKTIEITNNGNVRNFNFTFSDSIPEILKYFFYPDVEPSNQEYREKRLVNYWKVENINPNQSINVSYRLNFFVLLLSITLSAILVFAIIRYLKRPLLMKRYTGFLGKNKEVTISIHVINRGKKTIKNVIVKDFVPSVIKVINKFDTLKPKVKRKENGVELLWKIKKIKPKEELILNYRIKSALEVIGDLKLPKTKMMHESKSGKKRISVSKSVLIKGKIK